MARLITAFLLLLLPAMAQELRKKPEGQREADLKEEDASLSAAKEYVFNPLQAAQELKVGDFYWKKGSHKAAAQRYEEATKWNPMLPEAWLKLGEAREKLKDAKGARAAYEKYLELAPDARNANSIKRKLDKLS